MKDRASEFAWDEETAMALTVVIPGRDEAVGLRECLHSQGAQGALTVRRASWSPTAVKTIGHCSRAGSGPGWSGVGRPERH